MTAQLTRLIYLSSATRQFSKQNLRDLLAHCRDRNEPKDVTGLLLYRDGSFLQVIEGPESAVDTLYHEIKIDNRHGNVIRVIKEDITERYFKSWSMGFKDMEQETAECRAGFDALMNQPQAILTEREFPRSVAAFVKTFVR